MSSSFVSTLEKIATVLSGGLSEGVPIAVALGKDVVDLIDHAIPIVSETDAAKLQATRDALEPQVLAHADRTEAELRGGQA